MAYRESGDQRFLDTARRTADYFIGHLPGDRIPYWDFDAPGSPTSLGHLGGGDRGSRAP